MSRIEANALMRRLLREHVTLPSGAPFEVSLAEKFILCDPHYNHLVPVPGAKSGQQLTREALTSGFDGSTFKGRSFVVKT